MALRKPDRGCKFSLLFVIDSLAFGGGERVFAQLINALSRKEYDVFLASYPNHKFYHSIHGHRAHFIPVDFSNRVSPLVITKLVRIIIRNRIDIVHGQGGRAEFYARLATKLTRRAKYVSTIAMPVEGFDVGSLRKKVYTFLDHFTERFVDRFIVVSEALRNRMISQHGIPPEKVIKIYNGIEIECYTPDSGNKFRNKILNEYGLDKDTILIGAIGRLVWQKGFEYLIRAIPTITKECPEVKFLIVGEGPLRKELVALSRELGVNEEVIFPGFRSDIADILAAVDLLAVPSLLEGFPMVTLEAMAMAKPIVATNIDGITEQMTDGVNGILVPPEDPVALATAVIRLLGDRKSAQQMGMAARGKVEREFSVERMVSETEKVYMALLK